MCADQQAYFAADGCRIGPDLAQRILENEHVEREITEIDEARRNPPINSYDLRVE